MTNDEARAAEAIVYTPGQIVRFRTESGFHGPSHCPSDLYAIDTGPRPTSPGMYWLKTWPGMKCCGLNLNRCFVAAEA